MVFQADLEINRPNVLAQKTLKPLKVLKSFGTKS